MAVLDQAGVSEAATSYDALAPHYDAYTRHPNYPNWVRSLEGLARGHGLRGQRALDLGCGTGESMRPLLELGYDVVGCDASAGMVAQASRKLPSDVQLRVADMRSLPELGCFDLVWSVNDGINYLTGPDDLRTVFAAVATRLSPDGTFLFDLNTLRNYGTVFATTVVRTTEALFMTWIGTGDASPAAGAIVEATLEIFALDTESGLWRRTTSRHRQRHHPLDEVHAALAEVGLRAVGVHGLTAEAVIEDELDTRRHGKAIFVVTRAPGRR